MNSLKLAEECNLLPGVLSRPAALARSDFILKHHIRTESGGVTVDSPANSRDLNRYPCSWHDTKK